MDDEEVRGNDLWPCGGHRLSLGCHCHLRMGCRETAASPGQSRRPRVEGTVTRSTVDDSRREIRPHVVYTYTVAGTPYTSSQISFDLFDKPGGQGRVESIVARYPVGQNVTVYYDPNEPATALLEPAVYSHFLLPLLFGALFFFGGSLILWKALRQVMDGRPVPQRGTAAKHRMAATAAMSALIYVILVLVSFDSAVRDTSVKAFGERPAGIPN